LKAVKGRTAFREPAIVRTGRSFPAGFFAKSSDKGLEAELLVTAALIVPDVVM
jgi:hypothetical protein